MNILVTGVSRGLGLEIIKVLLQEGHTIYGINRTSTAELNYLQEDYPNNLFWLSYDLGNMDNLKETIFKKWLKDVVIHGFVNNAALAYDTLLTNMDYRALMNMTMVNQIGPMMMTKYVLRNMLLNDVAGSIVHISSISVHTGYKGLAMYAATKGALEAFSKNTAREWGVKGIRSNCVVAGFMETEMTSTMDDETIKKIFNRTSLKKTVSLSSVANSVSFLLSSKSESITGQNIFVDSGVI
jgi:3-oxoacyl-[acyl-carrier protein] reductase